MEDRTCSCLFFGRASSYDKVILSSFGYLNKLMLANILLDRYPILAYYKYYYLSTVLTLNF